MASAKDVAKFILTLVDEEEGDFVTSLKLQKLLYYCQGFHLAIYDTPLFGERLKRWDHGPVVPEVWHEYKDLGSRPIPCPDDVDFEALSEQQRELVNEVYAIYGAYSATALRNMTHAEPPWLDTSPNDEITHEVLKSFFRTRLVDG